MVFCFYQFTGGLPHEKICRSVPVPAAEPVSGRARRPLRRGGAPAHCPGGTGHPYGPGGTWWDCPTFLRETPDFSESPSSRARA